MASDVVTFHLGFDDDQRAVGDLFRSFFDRESPPTCARAAEPLGFDRRLWDKAVATGAVSIAIDAAQGGGGGTPADAVIVAEAAGAAIAPIPLVDHLAAVTTFPAADVVAGDVIAAVALQPATPEGTWRLVPAGAVADVVIGVDGRDLVAVRSAPPGRGPHNHGSQPLADRSARAGERIVLGPATDIARALATWKMLSAAALVGLAGRALAMGLAYVTERTQFGVPIGSFQAVQHGLADLPALVDGGRMLAHKAAWAVAGDGDGDRIVDPDANEYTDFEVLASMAFVFAGDAAATVTDRSLHYHGGYGFAEEYDIQLYYRRARGWRLVAGDPGAECLTLADRLFGPIGSV
jgi:alkylation response protein AidB-like acyl-CoA dehydrogenase